jgi:hypothetical protein
MLEIVVNPVAFTTGPEGPPDPGVAAIKGLFVRQVDKLTVVKALDHAEVDAWQERMRWFERWRIAGAVLLGARPLESIPGLRKGYTSAEGAHAQAKAAMDGAQWHQTLYRQAGRGLREIARDPTRIGQYPRHAEAILDGIQRGVRIIERERAEKAANAGKAPPPPKYWVNVQEVPAVRYDYQREVIYPVDLSSISPAPGLPRPRSPQYNPQGSNQPLKARDGSPIVDALNPPRNRESPKVPLREPEPVQGATSEVQRRILARDLARLRQVLSPDHPRPPGGHQQPHN